VRHLNDEEASKQRAGFVLSLKPMGSSVVFTPTFADVETAVVDTYDGMIKAASDIPRFEQTFGSAGEGETHVNAG